MGGDGHVAGDGLGGRQFQSTPRMGGDADKAPGLPCPSRVSIHAPAWGATGGAGAVDWDLYLFQSTPPHGGRLDDVKTRFPKKVFQSTPPHGGRPSFWRKGRADECFNPRPRMGGDEMVGQLADRVLAVSIHAPAWGATACCEQHDSTLFLSAVPRTASYFLKNPSDQRSYFHFSLIFKDLWICEPPGDSPVLEVR